MNSKIAKMNIGIVTAWFERGAAYVSKLYKEELEKKHNVYIYARGGEEYANNDPVWDTPEVWWGKQRITPFESTVIDKRDFYRWIQENKIEAVLFNEQHWWEPLLWCKELKVKTAAYIDYYTEETIPLFAAYDMLICNTRRHFSAYDWHPGAKYIPWGTDTELFKPKSSDFELVNESYVTFFHSCGMGVHRKGTDLLIRAFDKTKKAKKLIIHTQVNLNLSFKDLAPTIDRLIRDGRLEIINKTVHAPGLYHHGDVYVYPTKLEGIGLTVPEALACGLFCVVPDNAPMNEFINEFNGLRVKVSKHIARRDGYYWPKCIVDIDDLTEKIDFIAQNQSLVLKGKAAARLSAVESFNWSKNAERINALFESVEFSNIDEQTSNLIKLFESAGFKRFHKTYLYFYPVFNTIRNLSLKYKNAVR